MSHDTICQLRNALRPFAVGNWNEKLAAAAREALAAADAALAVPEPTDVELLQCFAPHLDAMSERFHYGFTKNEVLAGLRAARAWQPAPGGREGE